MKRQQHYGTYICPEDPPEYTVDDLLADEQKEVDPDAPRLEYTREAIANQRERSETDLLVSNRNSHGKNMPIDTYHNQLRNVVAAEDLLAQVGCVNPVRKFEPLYKAKQNTKIPGHVVRQMCDLMVDLARMEGLWPSASCADLGLSRSSLEYLKKQNPRFAEAFEYAQAEASRFWARVGTLGIIGRLPRFSASSWQFLMKNVCGWKDKVEVEGQINNLVVTAQIGKDGSVIQNTMDGDEAQTIIMEAQRQVEELSGAYRRNEEEDNYQPDEAAKFFRAVLAEAEDEE